MRVLRALLAVVLTLCVAWLAAYGIGSWRMEQSSRKLALGVQRQRDADRGLKAAEPTGGLEVTAAETPAPQAAVSPSMPPAPTALPAALPTEPEAAASPTAAPAIAPTAARSPTKPTEVCTPEPSAEAMAAPTIAPTQEPTAAPSGTPDPLLAYYAQLAEQNADMIGWIHVEDTKIDYPVMYTPDDPEYYLHRDFERRPAFEGVPFLDARCDPALPSDNLIVYGHNMRNGGMFGTLKAYLDEAFFAEHPYVAFDTLAARGTYRVFAVLKVRIGAMESERMRCYGVSLTEDEQQTDALRAYVEEYALQSDGDALPQPGDQVLTLSTRTGIAGGDVRLVVMATRIHEEEIDKPAEL